MWSVERTARMSSLDAQQRVLFPVTNHSDTTGQRLTRALLFGICTGVALLTPDDPRACRLVSTALQNACTKNPLLARSRFAVVVETGPQWTLEQLRERVQNVLQQLQLSTLAMLLLHAQTLALVATSNTYERKRVVLQFWEHMVALQQSGLVAQIGVSGFSTQLTEFIFTAHPQSPPVATALSVSVASSAADEHARDDQHHCNRVDSLLSAVVFAHGRGMDVLRVQFPTTHEADAEPFQIETRSTASTTSLQTPLQIAVRYLLQRGLVVVPSPGVSPMPSDSTSGATTADGSKDAVFEHDERHELFHALLHPFTALAPSHSPNELYSSVLSREHMDALDQTLALSINSSSPLPPASASSSASGRT